MQLSTHDGGPHVLVGLLVGDEVNGSLAGRAPQHGVPGGPGQRDVVDGVEPRLRPEGVPVALHHVRQGQDVGVEVAVVELAEGLPPHDVGGQPVFLCAHRFSRSSIMLARFVDVHAVHEPQRAQLICRHFSPDLQKSREAEAAVVALLDRGLQGAPAGEGFWRGLGLGLALWRSLGHGHGPLGLASFLIAFLIAFALGALVVAVLAELFSRRPADRRAHRGDVAQQEVEVVAAPVVKDHWDGLGRLGRDVAGVAQRPEILPGAVAVVELLLGGLQ